VAQLKAELAQLSGRIERQIDATPWVGAPVAQDDVNTLDPPTRSHLARGVFRGQRGQEAKILLELAVQRSGEAGGGLRAWAGGSIGTRPTGYSDEHGACSEPQDDRYVLAELKLTAQRSAADFLLDHRLHYLLNV
jgi:hypothetical protein